MLVSLAHGAGHAQAAQAVTVTVNVAQDATLSGEQNFRVLVTTDEVVTKVEMFVGTERRAEAQSTPYRFALDTINEKDGPIDLKWVAYTDQGHKGTLIIHAKVDNGASLEPKPTYKTESRTSRMGSLKRRSIKDALL